MVARTISTIIVKPTKFCNAACTYCSAPPDGAPKWSFEDFKLFFDRVEPHLTRRAYLIWHGGEPMLMAPDFYRQAFAYARARQPEIRFSIQSNLLAYDTRRWRDVFIEVFDGSISSSFDPDISERLYKGSAEIYARRFHDRLDAVLADGFRPKVIGTYTEATAHLMMQQYEWALSKGEAAPQLRFNYRFPVGRDEGKGEAISPQTYGQTLLALYDRWIVDLPAFVITPLDEMLKKTVLLEAHRCPWTNACGGSFLGVEPNLDVYNCSEFADLGDTSYRFGNLREEPVETLLDSPAARAIRRRRVDLPASCRTCRHFGECEGGCARDAVLYGHGLGGKYHYCHSWIMVFDRIKQSIRSGEADGALTKYGLNPVVVREQLKRAA